MKYLKQYNKLFERKSEVEKINFEWNGFQFKNIPLYKYGTDRYYVSIGSVSQVVRQYIKQKYKIPFQISSDSYSGGDSIHLYISPLDVDKETFDKISSDLETTFKAGYFDGMEDIYNYTDSQFVIEYNGQNIEFDTKYFFTEQNMVQKNMMNMKSTKKNKKNPPINRWILI